MQNIMNYEDAVSLLKDITGAQPQYFMVKEHEPYAARFRIERDQAEQIDDDLSSAFGPPSQGYLAINNSWHGLRLKAWRRHSRRSGFHRRLHQSYIPFEVQLLDRKGTQFDNGDEAMEVTLIIHPAQ